MNDGTDTSADVQTLVKTGDTGGWRFANGKFYDKANKGSSFLDDLIARLIEYVKDLGRYAAEAAAFLNIDGLVKDAVDFIIRDCPISSFRCWARWSPRSAPSSRS